MSDTCGICETLRPNGGTNHLVLNDGELWIEFCGPCGEKTKLKNQDTNEETTLKELFDKYAQDDADADADALSSAGYGTDEDYGGTDEKL